MGNKIKKAIYIIVSISLIAGLIYISNLYTQEEILLFVQEKGRWAPILYITIQILGQIFAPLSTSILFVGGFILFGRSAIIYMILVWIITSYTNFFIARRYGMKALNFFLGEKGIQTVKDITAKLNNKKYYTLRILTFYINDFASYAFGLTNISLFHYTLSTLLGIIPWAILMTLVVQNEGSILNTTLKVFTAMIPFSLVSILILKNISLRRLFKSIRFWLENIRI